MKFSIDMINLHLIIKRDNYLGLGELLDGQEFVQKILFNQLGSEWSYYETNKFSAYKYNITCKTEEGTIYFGMMHNSKNEKSEIDLKIEYNPNKFKETPEQVIKLCNIAKVVKIKSIDYALDIFIKQSNIVFAESLKNVNTYKGTYYIGERAKGLKIYDKGKEQKQDIDWTRIEYRIPLDYICKSVCEFNIKEHLEVFRYPDIIYIENIEEEEIDIEMILILEGLKIRPELHKKLTRRKKEKIEKTLQQLAKVEYSALINDISHHLKKYIDTIIIY